MPFAYKDYVFFRSFLLFTKFIFSRLIVFAILIQPLSVAASAGTIGYWKFEHGTANSTASGNQSVLDSSGNGFHGTPSSSPIYVTSSSGRGSIALSFPNAASRVFIPDNPAFELTKSLTIEATIRLDATPTALSQILFRGDNRGGYDPYYLAITPSRTLSFLVTKSLATPNDYSYLDSAPINLGQWYRVAASLDDATGRQSIFINGVEVAHKFTSVRPFGPLVSGLIPGLGIGNLQSGSAGGQPFRGLIDEVKLSDVAKSSAVNQVPEPSSVLGFGVVALSLLANSKHRFRARK